MSRFVITDWCQERIRQMTAGDRRKQSDCPGEPLRYIDATAGAGKDTLFLCELLDGQGGEVLAMDIQELALQKTRARLLENGFREEDGSPAKESEATTLWSCLCDESGQRQIRLLLRGHEHMDEYFPEETVDLILFNLGYLPGGDHALATKPETTLTALTKALRLLKPGGLLSLMIYSGGDSGFEEKEQVLVWLRELDARQYLVLAEEFINRPNHPPLPVFVRKLV